MTLQERRRRSMALTGRLKTARERLATALQAMDYEQALTFQVEVDELQDQVATLRHNSGNPTKPKGDRDEQKGPSPTARGVQPASF
jgi:hypothetical protein